MATPVGEPSRARGSRSTPWAEQNAGKLGPVLSDEGSAGDAWAAAVEEFGEQIAQETITWR